ncbi:TlpA family protein disulfide reductase [Allomuricauda sp. d1]|uniref:TlpA family protein disulfide reductase n=1 Tax=Allomuricauda sp. d1 TaxID=3136725 RepID=UPI0031CF441C
MNRLVTLLISALFLLIGCKSNTNEDVKAVALDGSKDNTELIEEQDEVKFPIYDFESFKPLLNKEDDKTYIVNFWATWCKPCIEEMPYFEKTYAEQKQNGVELVLVSLDMPAMWKTRLEPFVEKRGLQGKVVILDDPKMNDWIPKVDENWGGGIPATLIYNKEKRAFFERGFTYEELNEELKKFL